MIELIPRDAAIGAIERWWMCSQTTWQSPMTILRAIPAIDPAAIREAALREAVKSLRDWQNNLIQRLYPDSAITVGMAADVVEALIGEKK